MNETKRPFRELSTNDVEDLILSHLEVAAQCARELVARAHQRFTPAPGQLKRLSGGKPVTLLNVGEAAAVLGVNRRTVQRYINTGRLSYVIVGKRRLIEGAALDDFMERGTMADP